MDFSEKDAGSRENRLLSFFSPEPWEPVMLPLLFLPTPREKDRREALESIEVLPACSSP
jgi:hypothetical protein